MSPAKLLLITGAILLATGLIWWLLDQWSGGWHVPGDIVIKRKNVTFYFPLGTCLLISIILSLVLWLFRK